MHRARAATRRVVFLEPGRDFCKMTNISTMAPDWHNQSNVERVISEFCAKTALSYCMTLPSEERKIRTFLLSATLTCTAEGDDILNNAYLWEKHRRLVPAQLHHNLQHSPPGLLSFFPRTRHMKRKQGMLLGRHSSRPTATSSWKTNSKRKLA